MLITVMCIFVHICFWWYYHYLFAVIALKPRKPVFTCVVPDTILVSGVE